MASACALVIIRGKKFFNFGIAERLRALRYPIFTGGGRKGKRHLQRLLSAKAAALQGSGLALSVTYGDSSPKGERAHPQALHLNRKLCRHAKGSPFEERLPPLRGKMSP